MKTVNVKGTLIVPRVEKLGTDKKSDVFTAAIEKSFFELSLCNTCQKK
jgi:hypothetical protein